MVSCCLDRAFDGAESILAGVLAKARFWEKHAGAAFNERQRDMINRLLDGFEGKLTSSKWATIEKCSPDTALRDINDLLERGILDEGRRRRAQHQLFLNRGLKSAATDASLPPGAAISFPHCVRRLPGFERRFAPFVAPPNARSAPIAPARSMCGSYSYPARRQAKISNDIKLLRQGLRSDATLHPCVPVRNVTYLSGRSQSTINSLHKAPPGSHASGLCLSPHRVRF